MSPPDLKPRPPARDHGSRWAYDRSSRVVAASREFRTLLTVFVLQALATGAMLAGVDYVARVLLGRSGASTILFVCFVAPAILVTPLWQRLGEARGKRAGYVAGSLLLAGAALGGVDALVFSGGIGENDPATRSEVIAGCGWLGAELDPSRNAAGTGCISADASRLPVWVIPTDEERLIARHTLEVLA